MSQLLVGICGTQSCRGDCSVFCMLSKWTEIILCCCHYLARIPCVCSQKLCRIQRRMFEAVIRFLIIIIVVFMRFNYVTNDCLQRTVCIINQLPESVEKKNENSLKLQE
jgi:hypothetical protein